VRISAVSVGLVALIAYAAPLDAQFAGARGMGMGGVSLTRDGTLTRYNPAYRAVLDRPGQPGGPKLTVPLPLGLYHFFREHPIGQLKDDPMFHPDSANFNPVDLINLILNPPFNYPLKDPDAPTNDIEFGIGKDSLQILLGSAQAIVPAGPFGITSSARLFDFNVGVKGARIGVTTWMQTKVTFQLGDSLISVLKEGNPVTDNTNYTLSQSSLAQAGFAPSLGWAGKVYGTAERGFYLGGNVHYYFGVAYAQATSMGGFTTGDTIFGNTLALNAVNQISYSGFGNSFGHGIGVDLGAVWVSGPIEVGLGVSDIGATLTWGDTRTDFQHYDTTTNEIVTDSIHRNRETKTKLPVLYIANLAYTTGNTTVGFNLVNGGNGTQLRVGAEQRFGVFVVRGGLGRDQRKQVQFGGGGGIRLGAIQLDVGIATHSNSLSDERGYTLATSLSIY
jgi:hypothetical protein